MRPLATAPSVILDGIAVKLAHHQIEQPKMTYETYLTEVTDKTRTLSSRAFPTLTGDEIVRLKLSVPGVRKLVAAGYSFYDEAPKIILDVWEYIWNRSPIEEVMHQALYYYQRRTLTRHETRRILEWIERCRDWPHSDDLSKIYADVVEAHPDWIVPTLKRWNRSENPWKRRQSVVSLIEYARKRSRFLPFEELIGFVVPLLDDDDYYVQKGVGWTVREIGNAYPEEIAIFMAAHAGDLAAQAWTGATKNLDPATKARYRAIRNQTR